MNQLFANLFENSLRYTDAGGDFIINVARHDGLVTIDLQDSAPGVSEQDVNRLFERLYRVDRSRSRTSGGAGLGLAICKNIVEAHEGASPRINHHWAGCWSRSVFRSREAHRDRENTYRRG